MADASGDYADDFAANESTTPEPAARRQSETTVETAAGGLDDDAVAGVEDAKTPPPYALCAAAPVTTADDTSAAEIRQLRSELDVTTAEKEALAQKFADAQRKADALHAENHASLSRAIASEQRVAELVQERDRLKEQLVKAKTEQFVASAGNGGGSATEVSLLELIEHERQNAKKHNELRLAVETNFADLSMQYETLQAEFEDVRNRATSSEEKVKLLTAELEEYKSRCSALETNVAELAETKEHLLAELASLQRKLEDEKQLHDTTKQACLKAHAMMRQMEEDMEAARQREMAAKRELEALKKKAAAWKKQAEQVQEVEARNDQLQAQLAAAQRENQALLQSLRDLQARLLRQEDEERRRRESEITPKMYQFLKDQLDELRRKYDELHEKERRWLHERDDLLVKIKRLTNELRNKNPSALRLMEVEVQNELLMGMLQGNAALQAGQPNSALPQPPQVQSVFTPAVAKGKVNAGPSPAKGGAAAAWQPRGQPRHQDVGSAKPPRSLPPIPPPTGSPMPPTIEPSSPVAAAPKAVEATSVATPTKAAQEPQAAAAEEPAAPSPERTSSIATQ